MWATHQPKKTLRARSIRVLAVGALATAIGLAACGIPPSETVREPDAGSSLIVDIAPVGSPSISVLRGYVYPELRPVSELPPLIWNYRHPEMWPEAQRVEGSQQTSGPR